MKYEDIFDNVPCREDPDFWHDPIHSNLKRARLICINECPLATRIKCLEIAMKCESATYIKNRYGVYGGLLPEERIKLAKQRKKAAKK